MMRYIDSQIPKHKLSDANMIGCATRQLGDVFFTGFLIVEDGAVSDIGLHGPFGSWMEGHTFSCGWTGRNEDDLNAGRLVHVPDDDSIAPDIRAHLIRCFKGALEHGENPCIYQPE
jgi:hypothetical protein